LLIQMASPSLRYGNYSLLHVSNPPWTLASVLSGSIAPDMPTLLVVVPVAAAVVFALNLPGLIGEIGILRIVKPRRVAEEEAERAAHAALNAGI
jgi:hypothetical protein